MTPPYAETLLEAWFGDAAPIPILDAASVSLARQLVRDEGGKLSLPAEVVESLVTAASELARNQLVHAREGRFAVRPIERRGLAGLELIAGDRGRGIASATRALRELGSTAGGLGSGIAAAQRLSDELDFDIRLEQGSCVRARKYEQRPPYRSEVAVVGRPLANVPPSGDDAAFATSADALVAGVVDGLGHGPLAHEAAAAAASCLLGRKDAAPLAILESSDRALVGTRGAVMAVARVDRASNEITHAGVGDIQVHVYRRRSSSRLPCRAGFLGASAAGRPTIHEERSPFEAGDVVVMFSDGLRTRVDLSGEPRLLREHPVVIAEHLLEHFGRDNDDAIVLVAR